MDSGGGEGGGSYQPIRSFACVSVRARENDRESRDDGWDMRISQKLFLYRKSVSRDVRDYLGWRHIHFSDIVWRFLESYSSSIKLLDLLEIVESISNSRIWSSINHDKPISLLLKPFSSNKRLFHSERHFEFSNFADVSGSRLPFSWHLKIAYWSWHIPRATLEDSFSVSFSLGKSQLR